MCQFYIFWVFRLKKSRLSILRALRWRISQQHKSTYLSTAKTIAHLSYEVTNDLAFDGNPHIYVLWVNVSGRESGFESWLHNQRNCSKFYLELHTQNVANKNRNLHFWKASIQIYEKFLSYNIGLSDFLNIHLKSNATILPSFFSSE